MSYACGTCRNSQLGALPGVVGTAIQVGGQLISNIGGTDDAKRFAAIDRRFQSAMSGDVGSLLVLKCWAGLPTPELNQFPSLAAEVGINAAGTNCGMATDAAKTYAMAKYQQAILQPQIADALVRAGIAITGTGAQMGSPLVRQGATVAGIGAGTLAVAGLAAFLILRRRRRS